MRESRRCLCNAFGALIALVMVIDVAAQVSPTKYLSADMAPVNTESVVDDLQGVVILCSVPTNGLADSQFVRLMALIHNSGQQSGLVVEVVPPDPVAPPDPCTGIRTREHVLLGRQVGIPRVYVVYSDLLIQYAPVQFDALGQIGLGSWVGAPPPDDSFCELGPPTAVCEMLPAEQPGGQWRLWVGTENGFLVEFGISPASGQIVEFGRYPVAVPPDPIHPVSCLSLIPQQSYYALGVGFGDGIRGTRPPSVGGAPAEEFVLSYPPGGPSVIPNFDHFYPPDPFSPTPLVLSNADNGTFDIAQVPANASGNITISPVGGIPPDDTYPIAVRGLATGSLLLLPSDSSGVFYDPWFSDSTGPSACYLNISEGATGACVACCDTPGDFTNDGMYNIADVTAGISFIFSGGAAPACADEADFNGDNAYNIADVTAGIAFIFSGGAGPVCGTTGG